MFEQLESRRMFAMTAGLAGDAVVVNGDAANNYISVVRSGTNVVVLAAYDLYAFPTTLLSVPEASVRRVVVRGGEGNDSLAVSGVAAQAEIHGDGGNDYVSGGSRSDLIFGGAGNDTLRGGSGGDTLSGGADNDSVYGEGGSDSLRGDSGNDLLVGGTGSDVLRGGYGNDTLDMRDDVWNNDSGYGEGGFDFALVDSTYAFDPVSRMLVFTSDFVSADTEVVFSS